MKSNNNMPQDLIQNEIMSGLTPGLGSDYSLQEDTNLLIHL